MESILPALRNKCFFLAPLGLQRIFLPFLSLCLFLSGCKPSSSPKYRVGISQIVEHIALDEARRGIEDTLKHDLGAEHLDIIYKNAQGNLPVSKQIAQSLVNSSPDVLVGISTPSAQTLKATLRSFPIPLVFACVTDAVEAGLVKSLHIPQEGIAGVVDTPPLEKQLALMRQFLPHLKKIGLLYSPGEANSIAAITRLKELCAKAHLEVVEYPVLKTSDISSVAHKVMSQVEAVYVPQDNAIVAAMPALIKVSYALKIPVFASDLGSVRQGALAAVCYGYYEMGVETGKKIVSILKGKKTETLGITSPQKFRYYKNNQTAEKLGISLPNTSVIPWDS